MRLPHKPTPARTYSQEFTDRSDGSVASMVLFEGGGIIDGILIANATSTETFIHIWDATSVPADTAVPHFPPITLPADSTIALDLKVPVKTGACISISSTRITTTISANEAFMCVKTRR